MFSHGSRTINPEGNSLPTLKLTLTLTVGDNFPRGQLSGYLSSRLLLQYKIYFHKGSVHMLRNIRGSGEMGLSKMLVHNYGGGGGGGG